MWSEVAPIVDSDQQHGRGSVKLAGVSKTYQVAPRGSRWRSLLPTYRWARDGSVEALADIDLDVTPGERLGLIGPNGSGKSTLLKVVAGVTKPSSGAVVVGGRVGSMIELGLGFHPDLTGIENVRCAATVLGFTRREITAAVGEIVWFSGLGSAVDEPLRTYSTGMAARLGFAVATHLPVDVLLVDEVLAVGDSEFQDRCIARVLELSERGVTVLFVSHEMPLVAAVCDRVVHLHDGSIVDDGPPIDVVERYLVQVPSRFRRESNSSMRIEDSELSSTDLDSNEPLGIRLEVTVTEPTARPMVAVDLELPTVAPGHPWCSAATRVSELSSPGRYRLTGWTRPMPAEAAQVNATISLTDDRTQRLHDSVTHFFVFGEHGARLNMAAQPTWEIEPCEMPRSFASAPAVVDMPSIALRGLTKRYWSSVRGARGRGRSITALDDIDLDVQQGSTLGIIGPNGSGKSTLLRSIAGVTRIDGGTIRTSGRIVPVLDLGLGFHPELSGRENIRVMARLLGLPRAGEGRRIDAVVDASGIEDAADRPVRTYSSGMKARLGFSLAVASEPAVLLVDELLAVGDEEFRRSAVEQVAGLRESGVTVLFVSHDLRLVAEVCQRVVRLQHGRLVDDGEPDDVIARYGGPAWVSGAADAGSHIRLHRLRLGQRSVPEGGTIAFTGLVEVDDGDPWARLVLSYRVAPEDRSEPMDADEVALRTFFTTTLEPTGGCLSETGWYRFRCLVEGNAFHGRADVVVSVLDDRDNSVLADAWGSVVVGVEPSSGAVEPDFDVDWRVERVG